MKKWIVIAVVICLMVGAFFYFWQQNSMAGQTLGRLGTIKAEKGLLRTVVASNGKVVANLDVDIKCKASGEVVRLPFDVSDTVKKGELLVELDPVDETRILRQEEVNLSSSVAKLDIAKQNLLVAEQALKTDGQRAQSVLRAAEVRARDAKAKAERAKALLEKKLISQEDFDTTETSAIQAQSELESAKVKLDELKTQEAALELKRQEVKLAEANVEANKIDQAIAQDRLHDTKVLSPMDGVVVERKVQTGQIISSGTNAVNGGTTILTISDLSRIFVLASVDESDIGKVKIGLPVTIEADAFPGRRFNGKIERIATKGLSSSSVVTFEVKIEVMGEQKQLLKPEMTTNVKIVTAEKDGCLLVPVECLFRSDGQPFMTIVKTDGTTENRPIETGLTDGARIEVVKGLSEGETVQLRKPGGESKWNAGSQRGGRGGGGMGGAGGMPIPAPAGGGRGH